MKIFYHKDKDGECAGFLVFDRVPSHMSVDCIGIDYKMNFPIETIESNEVVWIVDYSITPNEMRALLSITPNVVWIDHHGTAIEKFKDFGQDIEGLRYDGVSGAMLTYCYLNHMTGTFGANKFNLGMTENVPLFIKLIDDNDVHSLKYGEDTRDFQSALYADDFNPKSPNWNKFFEIPGEYEKVLLIEGKGITKYKKNWAKLYVDISYATEFHGHKCIAMNMGMCSSNNFDSVAEGYEILIPFSFDGEQYKVTMYSDVVDVSKIAEQYECNGKIGGGHKGAAGFQCLELPFKKTIK